MKKYSHIIIGVLLLIIIGQGYFLYKYKSSESGTPPKAEKFNNIPEPSDLLDRLKQKFQQDDDSTNDIFDDFFNDSFFDRHNDPFKEMEEIRERLFKGFHHNNGSLFNRSWDNWYGDKFGLGDIDISTKEEADKIIMEFNIPGLKGNTVHVDINEKTIKLEADIQEEKEEKDSKGYSVYRSSSRRHISKVLPVPGNADANKAEIKTEGEKLRIIFPKIT